jgi:hypothetical protein
VLLWLTACAAGPRTGGATAGSDQLQLCVQNETVGYGNIVAHAGMVRFDVMPGQQVCKRVPGLGPFIALQATTTGGGATGPISYALRLQVGTGRCWTWRLTELPASAYDVTPCAGEPAGSARRGGAA